MTEKVLIFGRAPAMAIPVNNLGKIAANVQDIAFLATREVVAVVVPRNMHAALNMAYNLPHPSFLRKAQS
jgi:hypothetical protein